MNSQEIGMDIKTAQQDMVAAYYGGSTGLLSSGMVWGVAAMVSVYCAPFTSMLTLFFGGMFIFPLSVVFAKLLGCPGGHQKHNPLGPLAIETTLLLFVGLFLAFFVATFQTKSFYAIMLLVIGCRYLMFQTLYGNRVYWFIGALLVGVGAVCLTLSLPFSLAAFFGAVIEIVFAVIIFQQVKRQSSVFKE